MFVVTLKFADKSKAAQHMEGHNAWIKRGFDDGFFLLVGSIRPNVGGAVLAHGIAREALESLVKDDPFVAEGVVSVDIIEIAPSRVDERLSFVKA